LGKAKSENENNRSQEKRWNHCRGTKKAFPVDESSLGGSLGGSRYWTLINLGACDLSLIITSTNTDRRWSARGYTSTFDNPVKGISHISFFGSPSVPHVPDGGTTVMLLGAGLSGLGLVGRFLKR